MDGWINVDKAFSPAVDMYHDLENIPWPWLDSSIKQVMLVHVLEHLGQQTKVYLNIIKELYRVCKPGAEILIVVPHPRHDDFLGDPTHVRPITPDSLKLFSKEANKHWIANHNSNTPLAMQLGVDFRVKSSKGIVDPRWQKMFEAGKMPEDLHLNYNNVIKQYEILLEVVKDGHQDSNATLAQPAGNQEAKAG